MSLNNLLKLILICGVVLTCCRKSCAQIVWSKTGNSGTVDGNNFIGTADNVPLSFRVNNYLSGKIDHILNNTFWGYKAGINNLSGNNNTLLGSKALGSNILGYNNTAIGDSAGYASIGNNNVFIGHQAGANETGNNKLYIGNKSDHTLIYGDFSTGKVLIGNSDPINYNFPGNHKLYVEGGIVTDRINLALVNDWADYVFDENYKLMPLQELENYIKEKKHLPNVPSAEEVRTNGINVIKMHTTLLEKIEELHLYALQLQEDNDLLDKQITQMKQLNEVKKMIANK